MKPSTWTLLAGGFVLLGTIGCNDNSTGGLPPAAIRSDADRDVDVQSPRRNVEVNTGPGGVDVDINGRQPATGKKVGVDVAPGGGVDVNVDGAAIRDGIQQRRAERTGE